MADAIEYFKSEKDTHVKAAQAIIAKAEAEGRALSDEERGLIKDHTTAATEFQGRIKDAMDNAALAAQVAELGADLATEPAEKVRGQHRSMAEAFVRSDAFQALKARGTAGRWTSQPVEVPRFGAAAGIVTEGAGSNAEMILPTRIPGIQTPTEAPLVIAALFGQGTISRGNTVLLAKETVTVNAAAVVAEAGLKPASDIQFDTVSVTLEKIATVIKVATEMLEDEDAMLSYLENRLDTFVGQKEEAEIVAALLAQAGQVSDAAMIGGDNLFDSILAGAVKCRTEGGLDADAVVLTPLDFAKLSVLKTSQDVYYSGGPYGAAGRKLWGLYDVALSERIGDGNAVVGAFKQGGTVWRKSNGVTVDATNANEADFLHNLTAIRAEERMALFLQRPDAFCVVSETS